MKLKCDSSELVTFHEGCAVCEHPEQELINVALLEKRPEWYLSRRFGIEAGDAEVVEHFDDHLMIAARMLAALDSLEEGGL